MLLLILHIFFLFLLSARLNTWTEISTTSSLLCRLCVYKTWKPVFTSFVILNTLSILWTGLKNKRIYNSVAHHNFFSHRRIFFFYPILKHTTKGYLVRMYCQKRIFTRPITTTINSIKLPPSHPKKKVTQKLASY